MHSTFLSHLLLIYGSFLILCGIVAVSFIGMKAKTALLSGGTSGGIIVILSWLSGKYYEPVSIAAFAVTMALLIVFSWRTTKTLFSVFDLLKTSQGDLKGKGIAFLIIALMAVVSVAMLGVQSFLFLKAVN